MSSGSTSFRHHPDSPRRLLAARVFRTHRLGSPGIGRSLLPAAALFLVGCAGAAVPVAAPPPTDLDAPPAGREAALLGEAGEPAVPALDTIRAGAFDNGKMWTFDAPPTAYLQDNYDFAPDSGWYARARLGALRIPDCSASLVSPHGLVMTNHHCARAFVTQVGGEEEDLLNMGFYAPSLNAERWVEDFEADQLVEIVSVTAEVREAVAVVSGPAERASARDRAMEAIAARIREERGGEDAGIEVEVVSLYNGGLYSAYVFRRYTRAKLVMAPELQLGYFGGDPDNFTYPRYALDVAFFRLYGSDGEPLPTTDYFRWSESGASAGDVVFVIGNPGSTSRLQTVAELAFRRDVEMPVLLSFIESRIGVLEGYLAGRQGESGTGQVRNSLFGLLNARKAYTGMLEGLRNPSVIARRTAAETAFRQALGADSSREDAYLSLFDEMAGIQEQKADQAAELKAFAAFGSPEHESGLILRTLAAYQYLFAQRQGASPEELDAYLGQLREVENRPADLDEALLVARFEDFAHAFGEDDAWVQALLGGGSSQSAARALMATSALADSARAEEALLGGTLDPASEPAFAFIQGMLQRFGPFQGLMSSVIPQEDEIAASLGRARFEVSGTRVPPDATFSLRLADGVVAGYPYNGTFAPARTTFYGLYDRHHSNPGAEEWALPPRWRDPPETFNLATPLNFVTTADIIGGNSGSPVVNRELEVVGLVFDGNIESLPGEYIYMPERNRSVAVDARGILEALDEIYDADRIVLELTTGRLPPADPDPGPGP